MAAQAEALVSARDQFALDYYPWSRVLFALGGHGPNVSRVEVSGDEVRIRAGWVFRVDVPRASLVRAYRTSNPWWNIGGTQTNMRGAWGICGSYRNIVALDLESRVRGRLFSVIPVSVRRLMVSLEDPDGFLAAVNGWTAAAQEGSHAAHQ